MPTPANRVKIQIVRGSYANLLASVSDLLEGEICFAKDQDSLYLKENGVLTPIQTNQTTQIADYIREITGINQSSEPMGHVNRTSSAISFNETTRVFSISPVSGSFSVWCKGIKYTYVSTESVTLPNETGLYYIFFDQNGDLSYQQSYFDWENHAPTSYVYWNASTGKSPYVADERHGITLDWQTHEYLHRTRGAVFATGFELSTYTINGDGSLDSHAQLDIAGGTFFDEDLEVIIAHSNSPVANTFQQDLNGPARIPVLRKLGQSWVRDDATDFPLQLGTNYPRYNLLTGSDWSSVDASVNKYIVYFIVATHNISYPVLSIQGQGEYANLGEAQDVQFSSIDKEGFPSLEFRCLYQLVYQVGSYPNSPNARLRSVIDLRNESVRSILSPGSGTVSGSINQLSDVDTASIAPVEKDTLVWDSATNNWVPGKYALGELSDVNTIGKIDQSVLTYDQSTGTFVANDVNTVITITDGGNF